MIQASPQRQRLVIALGDGCVGRGSVRWYHAAVTAGAYDRPVLSKGRQSEPGRTGALFLRVWLEGGSCEPQLRIRIISRQDLAGDAEDTASASTIEQALVYVHDWLERFTASAP